VRRHPRGHPYGTPRAWRSTLRLDAPEGVGQTGREASKRVDSDAESCGK
jgi:hypothetical protein